MKQYLFNNYLKNSSYLQLGLKNCWRVSTVKSWLMVSLSVLLVTPVWQTKAIAGDFLKVTFDPPAGDKPQASKGGASRSIGECIQQAENSNLPLTPVLPATAKALTVASHPTVLVYLPETSAQKVLFSWRNENDDDHYQAILPIKNEAGIISLTLPQEAPPLKIGENYQWSLAVMCDNRLQPDSPVIQGKVERVALKPAFSDRLELANSLETAALYGEAGIWYDTIATLAELKTAQPSDRSIEQNWQELLNSVGLATVAEAPIVEPEETITP